MSLIAETLGFVAHHRAAFAASALRHLALSGVALTFSVAIGLALTLALEAQPRRLAAAGAAVGVLRTVPSLAVFALLLPLIGPGFWPCVIALIFIGAPPVLLNAAAGLAQVDPAVIDAARGLGLRGRQILRRVAVPLALPVILAGVRSAAVQIIAGAALASFVGGGGLGDFIAIGIANFDLPQLLAGAAPIALLALAAENALAGLARAAAAGGAPPADPAR